MQDSQTPSKKQQVLVLIEPDMIERADRVAERLYGGNRSYLIRRAVSEHIERKEAELEPEQEAA